MKVEFKDSVMGDILCVDVSQFLLAKESEEEFDSLYRAVYAFYSTFCFDFQIDEIYDEICNKIGRRGKIIFTCKENCKSNERYVEIYALCNNNLKKVYSNEEN